MSRSPAQPILEDGARVGVLGGGPAGSMFAWFLLRLAEQVDLRLELEIFEPRTFATPGPAGCNMCGGIVSESFLQVLAFEGIEIPPQVVQRGLDAYVLHTGDGSVRIDTPLREKRIAAVHRGGGPRDVGDRRWVGLDEHLLAAAVDRGATVLPARATAVERVEDGISVRSRDGERTYKLLVGATGVNSSAFELVAPLLGSRPPGTARAFITELPLGEEAVAAFLGNAMHVFFSARLPGVDCAALIPKRDYVTVCLLGPAIDAAVIEAFFSSPVVAEVFPDGLRSAPGTCRCSPKINVAAASRPFADRIVLVGDCVITRLYKDGLGAAYKMAKCAARTAVLHGIGEAAFRRHYGPLVRSIARDNRYGRALFAISHGLKKAPPLLRAAARVAAAEGSLPGERRRMSTVFWDLFTGSASYRSTLRCALDPRLVATVARECLRRRPGAMPGTEGRPRRV